MYNKTYLKALASMMAVFLLFSIVSPASAHLKLRGKKIKIKTYNSKPKNTYRSTVSQNIPERKLVDSPFPSPVKKAVPINSASMYRTLERKLYTPHESTGLSRIDTWALTKSFFPIYKNQKALLEDLTTYTKLRKEDRVIYWHSYINPSNIPQTGYYVYELPQAVRYYTGIHLKTLSPKEWVLIRRIDGSGSTVLIKKDLEARAADPYHKPLPLSFVQLRELPTSAAQLWKDIGGKTNEKYTANHDFAGDFITFLKVAPESMKGKPIRTVKFVNGEYHTYDIYQLPIDRLTFNDITYTKGNSVVLVRHPVKGNTTWKTHYNTDATWSPNNSAVTIRKRDELLKESFRNLPWLNIINKH